MLLGLLKWFLVDMRDQTVRAGARTVGNIGSFEEELFVALVDVSFF